MSHPLWKMSAMKKHQLILIDGEARDWKLDPKVRERGFRGVAESRAALAATQTHHTPNTEAA